MWRISFYVRVSFVVSCWRVLGTIKRQQRERERRMITTMSREALSVVIRFGNPPLCPPVESSYCGLSIIFCFLLFLVSFSLFSLSWHEIACLSCLFSCFSFRLQSSLVHRCGDIAANEFEDEGAVHKNKKTTVFLTCGRDLCATRRWLLYAKVSMQCTVNRETG